MTKKKRKEIQKAEKGGGLSIWNRDSPDEKRKKRKYLNLSMLGGSAGELDSQNSAFSARKKQSGVLG